MDANDYLDKMIRADVTPEERAKRDAEVKEFIEKFASALSGESDECIHCGALITGMEQVGRCVYARPCGHRQYQGKLPERWR